MDIRQHLFFKIGFSRWPRRIDHRVHGSLLHIFEVRQSEKYELMRVLHLDAGSDMRGGQWQVLRLIEGLATAGVESILLAREGAPLYQAVRAKGWRVEDWGFSKALRLARNCDLVHAHDARSHSLAILGRAPVVVARRVAFPLRSRWKYRRAARYIAVSKFVKSVLIAGGVPEAKIAVVYDGVPLLELPREGLGEPWLRPLAPANAADPAKGAALAFEAARLACLPLQFSDDLERDLRQATLFVYLTYSEGLGSAALLAMSAGLPVVVSDIGGLREVIRHGVNGLLVENSAAAVAAAIRDLVERPDFARRLGCEARRTVETRFTCDLMVRRTMEVYREVLL
jgi:glycosyltransferase involved in cell wall biosynthesis